MIGALPDPDPRFVGKIGAYPTPKAPDKNLAFRIELLEEADKSAGVRQALMERCREDLLFWTNSFVMTYNPRLVGADMTLPFNTYPYQDTCLAVMASSVRGQKDAVVEKSRETGLSWMISDLFAWFFTFYDMHTFMLVSRKEDYVDKKGDSDSLFWKIEFILNQLPAWMKPNYTHTKLQMNNHENGSAISGESTNGDVGRGGRRTAFAIDEAAAIQNLQSIKRSIQYNTGCCIYASTPAGEHTEFYRQTQSKKTLVSIHWSMHPVKNRGLYRLKGNTVEFLDTTYEWPKDYEFPKNDDNLIGKRLRSPYYDIECERSGDKAEIAQELDIDHGAAGRQAFNIRMIEELVATCARPPNQIGTVEYDKEAGEMVGWVEDDIGDTQLWLELDIFDKPPEDKYIVAADVAVGTGSSNSAFSVVKEKTGEKVAAFASPHIVPQDFGALVVAVAKWFYNAKVIWDAAGPGRNFGQKVEGCGYMNVYLRTAEERRSKAETDAPGFFTTKANKTDLLRNYSLALRDGHFTNPHEEALNECKKFIYIEGDITHSDAKAEADSTGARNSHGDRVFADALAWFLCGKAAKKSVKEEKKPPTMLTPEGRFQIWERAKKRREAGTKIQYACQRGRTWQ